MAEISDNALSLCMNFTRGTPPGSAKSPCQIPVEILSLILSFLDRRSLRTVSTVSGLFCREADFHLYYWVNIRTYRQYNSFYIATLDTPKASRTRLPHFLRPSQRQFPKQLPPHRISKSRRGKSTESDCPLPRTCRVPTSTVGSFVPGHPVTRFELVGAVNELDVFECLLPALRKSSAPIEHLSITVMDCSSYLFEGIAASLPGLTHLSIKVSDPSDSSFYSLHAPKEESSSTQFTEAISRLACLQGFEYMGQSNSALQSFALFVEEIEIKILRDATGQWRVFSWCPKNPSSTGS
ncbi:hypothetical protein BS47DRAFT_1343557 [Hydnum rufescens UP504]|uniref:F-box domain-containing protein n=1 Tax=Hydnum rufescens UP504 TaxID=1448309 RepID=A0A9P6AXY6_9AGAM|nr:hypothetical protein BS47DRAFT_1343557 [Hydnum rufescens UP504]